MSESLDFRRHHAVIIGIDEYGGGIPRLRTAVADASRVAEVLRADHGYESPRLLTESVTLARLRSLFAEELRSEVGPDDRVLIYFAGHGIALDGDDGPAGYLVPQDARRDDRSTFLAMTDLSAWLEALPCRHLLLVLDCCFAGAFRWSSTRDLEAPPEVMYRERFDRFIRDPAWQVITSAAHDQKALDVLSGETIGVRGRDASAAEHSPFAAAFLRALAGEADVARGKANLGDGVVTATELYMFLRDVVEVGAEGISHRQTPGFWPLKRHDKGEFVHLVPGYALNLPPAPELTDEANPWRGLQSYDEAQAPLFFGRSQFVGKLGDRVRSQPLTVVLGASGTGKSSIVKAGLLSSLRAREPNAWVIPPPFRPGKSPLAALAALALPGEAADAEAVAERLTVARSDPHALSRRVAAWSATAPPGSARLLVVVDQFEELITLCLDAADREQFLLQLDRALSAHPDRLRVVLTLRSDFEPQFAHTPLEDQWLASRIVVPAWTLDEYREAIEGPASARVLYFRGHSGSQPFINRLIGDVANTPGALPLLSFTLSELYRRYLASGSGDRSLTEADYEGLGGVGGSLRNRADEIHDALPDSEHRATLQRVMLRMVSVEGGELARKRALKEEIVYASESENLRVAEVLRRMDEARLVVSGKDEDDRPIFEPAHDELIRGWSRLLQWTRENLGSLQLRQVLSPAVRDWSRDAQPDSGKLWHANPRLGLLSAELGLPHPWHKYVAAQLRKQAQKEAVEVSARPTWLNRDESRFVVQSLARKHRTTSIVATTTLATVAALAGLALFAFVERGNAVTSAGVARTNEAKAKAALDDTQHALARSLMGPIGVGDSRFVQMYEPPALTVAETEGLWEVAALGDDRVRMLFLKEALAQSTTASHLRRRVDSAVHCVVGLDGARRLRVINEIVLPILQNKQGSRDALGLEVRMACAEVGDQLEASRMSSGSEYGHMAVDVAVDEIKASFMPDPSAVAIFRRNLGHLTHEEMEKVKAELERFLVEHSTTNAVGGIEPMRGPLIGSMLLELRHRLEPDRSTPIIPRSQARGPIEIVLSQAEETQDFHQRFLEKGQGMGMDSNRYFPPLSDLGPVATALGMSSLRLGKTLRKPMALREQFKFKPKHADPTPEQSLAEASALRALIEKPKPSVMMDNSIPVLLWVLNFDAIAPKLPEDVRAALADLLLKKVVVQVNVTVLNQEFAQAFVMLARWSGPQVTSNYLRRCLAARSDLLTGGDRADSSVSNSLTRSYDFVTHLLGGRDLALDKFELINLLKYPICVGNLRRVVLVRLGEQFTPPAEKPFESVWDFVSWIEAHDPELAQLARLPVEGPMQSPTTARSKTAEVAR